ncbi:hypothetical protein DL769_001359 [Monosporascus sp. CRB-8-3]|nr:hypothetical protein DL769_001359 [Monosporascus sp. CRB-8-3]
MLAKLIAPALLALLAPNADARFTIITPQPMGSDPQRQREAPCGGFEMTDRSHGVTEWPVGGIDVAWDSANATAGWQVSAVLANDTSCTLTSKTNLRTLYTHATGPFCLPSVGGLPEWVGLDAVLQIQQWTGDGDYFFSCSAIKFVDGPAPPSTCNMYHGKRMRVLDED